MYTFGKFESNIPDNIEQIKINEDSLNICNVVVIVGFANSKSEAKRMIIGNGVRIDGRLVNDYNEIIDLKESKVIQFGENRFI